MIDGKRYRYTSGLIKGDSAEEDFRPPSEGGPLWTLDEISYFIVSPDTIRWIARWSRAFIILDTPRPPEDPIK